MDPRLLEYYNRELRICARWAASSRPSSPRSPDGWAGGFECADPYVERLLEGFAFLAARVQLKIDAEFPAFTQHLLETVYPHYLAPTPSMAVVQLEPDLNEGALAEGVALPRETQLRSTIGKGEQTACEYRTAHEVRLWPLELTEAEYFTHIGPVARADLPALQRSKAGIRLRLRTTAGLTFAQLAPSRRTGSGWISSCRGPTRSRSISMPSCSATPRRCWSSRPARPVPWIEVLPGERLRPLGFEEDEALLPYAPTSFHGYRQPARVFRLSRALPVRRHRRRWGRSCSASPHQRWI
jgi:type VI secretion system protein ImpG